VKAGPNANLNPYREPIVAHKPGLLVMRDLQEQIVAAGIVALEAFDGVETLVCPERVEGDAATVIRTPSLL
jgi:hypothetical protein